jgi:hypothetical protein
MANQVYIIPRRNDLDGVNIQVTDLRPNTSQRNLIYDGPGQSGYLKWSSDAPGLTQVDGDSFAGGSTQTQPIAALGADDTTGGGDDVGVPGTAQFGLAAYLRDRIDRGAVGAPVAPAEAASAANSILAEVEAGNALTAAAVNAILVADIAAGTSLTAGASFGFVEEILRIAQGQVYRVRALSIVTDQTLAAFLGLAARQAIVAAQTAAQILSQGQFYAAGEFLAQGEPGFRDFRSLLRTGAFNISNGEGVLSFLKDNIDWNNPNFAYTAAAVTALVPRARLTDGVPVPEDGIHPAIRVYDHLGNVL